MAFPNNPDISSDAAGTMVDIGGTMYVVEIKQDSGGNMVRTLRLAASSGGDGDITAVVAGEGLVGGATMGSAELDFSPAALHTSVIISGRIITTPALTNVPSGYSGAIAYSWGETGALETFIRIFADDGTDERLYRGTDLSSANLVYTKTY